MALLTFGTAAAKGASSTVTLSKSELLALPEVSGDSYWSQSANIKAVVVTYRSTSGGQDKRLRFDFTLASPTATFALSSQARDVFQVTRIILLDFDGGELILQRSTFIASTPGLSSLDIDLTVVTPPSSLLGLLASSDLIQWYKADSVTGVSDGAQFASLANSSGHSWTTNSNLSDYAFPGLYRPQFKLNQVNGLPAVHFADQFKFLQAPLSAAEKITSGNNYGMTTFTVMRREGASNYVWTPGFFNGTDLKIQIAATSHTVQYAYKDSLNVVRTATLTTPAMPLNVWTIVEAVKDGASITIKTHNASGTSSVTSTFSTAAIANPTSNLYFRLGNGSNVVGPQGPWSVAETAIYRKALSVAERAQVISYLTGKYNIPTV